MPYKVPNVVAYMPPTIYNCLATFLHEVTATTGLGGLSLVILTAVDPVVVNTTIRAALILLFTVYVIPICSIYSGLSKSICNYTLFRIDGQLKILIKILSLSTSFLIGFNLSAYPVKSCNTLNRKISICRLSC